VHLQDGADWRSGGGGGGGSGGGRGMGGSGGRGGGGTDAGELLIEDNATIGSGARKGVGEGEGGDGVGEGHQFSEQELVDVALVRFFFPRIFRIFFINSSWMWQWREF
jgi:hypothetical protein